MQGKNAHFLFLLQTISSSKNARYNISNSMIYDIDCSIYLFTTQ